MNYRTIIVILLLFLSAGTIYSQTGRTDANVVGHVVSEGEHLSFVNIFIKYTTIGTVTDETGHFRLVNLPVGDHVIVAQYMGYKMLEKTVTLRRGETIEVNFDMESDVFATAELVVTADRNARNRTDASVIVNTITPRTFSLTQSVTLNEGLSFMPGLRVENNCQNCGFNQVRMNGLEGPYSQVLVNSRAIFSGLAGVYGLEMIPANMIERVEVIRGGGSALYGSNAIAGTINIIVKDPISNSFEFNSQTGLTGLGVEGRGDIASEHTIGFNSSVVTSDAKSGLSIYGFTRGRDPFDANNDGFSNLAMINNTTIGSRLFHRFNQRSRLSIDFFNINEERRGGDRFDYPYHEADIAEAVRHNIKTAAATYEQFFRHSDMFSAYFSMQDVKRDSYYGAGKSLADYGRSDGFTWIAGSQYALNSGNFSMVSGLEFRREKLVDKKLGYADYANAVIVDDEIVDVPHTDNVLVADQMLNTGGLFNQVDYRINRMKLSAGVRFDMYDVKNEVTGISDNGLVISPRLNILYDILPEMQGRLSYSQGYRAPQVFDEDLHILTSGSRQVVIVNDPDLTRETSHSFMASVDLSRRLGNLWIKFLAEGFYTRLENPFANEYGDPDANGTVIYTRTNASEGAVVRGVNLELNMAPGTDFSLSTGLTLQSSRFDTPVEFDERKFFRTPGEYGYFTMNWQPNQLFQASLTGTYTGSMLVPYFGELAPDPEEGVLNTSSSFFDMGINFRYNIVLNGSKAELSLGMKNIFNSYQSDFDSGVERDPGYIYGPLAPRSLHFGLRVGIFQ